MSDEWRVEVTVGDEAAGVSMGERLLAVDLDDEAQEALGRRTIVTHDGPHVFLYSATEDGARTAETVVGDLIAQAGIEATVGITRWHPDEQAWKDASIPLPRTDAERQAEHERHEAAELIELAEQGTYDWEVRVELPGHAETVAFAERLRGEGLPVTRRWRYLLVGALTEADAHELSTRILAEAPEGSTTRIEAILDEPGHPLFVFLRSKL